MRGGDRDRIVLAGVVFAVLFAQVLLYPGVPDLVEALGGTPAGWGGDVDAILEAGKWFLTAEFVGFVLFAGVWGALSDATGHRRRFVVLGALGGAAGYLALPLVASVATLPYGAVLLVRFLQGAATIGAFSLAITTLMDLGGGHGRNMGAAGIAIGLGTALGAPIGGQLYAIGPFVPLYVAGGMLVVAASLAAVVPDRTTPSDRDGLLAALDGVRSRPILGLPYALGFIDRLTAGFFALVGTVFFQSAFPVGAAGSGILLGAFFAPFALLQYPMGRLSDRIGRVGPVAVGSLAYGLAVMAVLLTAPSVLLAALAMAVVGVFGATMAPATMALVTDLCDPDQRGAAMGGFNVVGSLGFLAGIVGGATVAARYGFEAAFLAVGLSEVVIAVVALPVLLRVDVPSAEGPDRRTAEEGAEPQADEA